MSLLCSTRQTTIPRRRTALRYQYRMSVTSTHRISRKVHLNMSMIKGKPSVLGYFQSFIIIIFFFFCYKQGGFVLIQLFNKERN